MHSVRLQPYQLAETTRGKAWLAQFDEQDRAAATRLLSNLSLVSHSAFERGLTHVIMNAADGIEGCVALYAVRELLPDENLLDSPSHKDGIDAVGRGNNLGSEARVAAIIRNICKVLRSKFINHPSIAIMREKKCRAIFVVDDFLGSGTRCSIFLNSMWRSKTIRSWHSFGWTKIVAVAYSATHLGEKTVRDTACRPNVIIKYTCPSFHELPAKLVLIKEIESLCDRMGRKTSKPHMRFGYKKTMASIVFEHGCPNNAPAILWAPATDRRPWHPLFPDRAILAAESSAFPEEIQGRDPIQVVKDLGHDRLAKSSAFSAPGPIGPITLMILAIIAKGRRTIAPIAHATGLTSQGCNEEISRCIANGFLTNSWRLTPSGRNELQYANSLQKSTKRLPDRGSDSCYPKQLRGSHDG